MEGKEMPNKVLLAVLLASLVFGLLTVGTNFILAKIDVGYGSSSTLVGGYISENTTWTLEGSPYIVTADVVVEPDVCLTIDPGVLIKFRGGTSLIVDGNLVAKGNSTYQIVFTSDSTEPSPGRWGTIKFRGNIEGFLNWIVIKYADKGISIEKGGLVLENCLIIENNIGVSIMGASFATIRNSSISYNTGDGLFVTAPPSTRLDVRLENVNIMSNGGMGVLMWSNCIIVINQCSIIKNGGDGISGPIGGYGDNCYITASTIAENSGNGLCLREWSWCVWHISGCTIAYNFGAGIYREDGSAAYPIYVTNSTIKGNRNSGILGQPGGYVRYSNLYDNDPYDLKNTEPTDVVAYYNWWGTVNETLIEKRIYDYYDDYNVGRVGFKPFLTSPATVADYIPPISSDDYDGAWRNADFTITLTVTDYESGIAETYYRINDGSVKAVSIDGQPRITTEGANNTLEYWSVDNAGNEELPHKILAGIKLDKTPPTVGSPSHMPEDEIQPNQEVKVLVNVTDPLSSVKNVTLSYNLNNSAIWIDLPMIPNSTTGLYEAIIPGQQANTLVKYKIAAYDNAGNYKVEDNSGEYYVYTVVPEFPSTVILLLALLFTTFAVIIGKKRLWKT